MDTKTIAASGIIALAISGGGLILDDDKEKPQVIAASAKPADVLAAAIASSDPNATEHVYVRSWRWGEDGKERLVWLKRTPKGLMYDDAVQEGLDKMEADSGKKLMQIEQKQHKEGAGTMADYSLTEGDAPAKPPVPVPEPKAEESIKEP